MPPIIKNRLKLQNSKNLSGGEKEKAQKFLDRSSDFRAFNSYKDKLEDITILSFLQALFLFQSLL
ncbi:hypothetical protein J41TS12_21540 [Paenibacillus antibioticophila]|uniref:Uncharacterized protein n=1 Tax=Paenibacillus antibioticophila TaxID=1274374 RepID=A0A919XVN2_9BACL|nr:hypothetical protein J41TS12_21540 [Paenibacillus antibioticophila]